MAITLGILLAQIVNYLTQHVEGHGWRISVGIAGEFRYYFHYFFFH